MCLSTVAHPSKHIAGKWPRKHEPHLGLHTLCSHLRCASGGCSSQPHQAHCLCVFSHPCPKNTLVLKNYFIQREKGPSWFSLPWNPFPAALGGSVTARPLGTPWLWFKTHPSGVEGEWPPATHTGAAWTPCCPCPACAEHSQLPSALPAAPLTLQSTSPWVIFQECPAAAKGVSALRRGGPGKEEDDEKGCGESLWQGAEALCWHQLIEKQDARSKQNHKHPCTCTRKLITALISISQLFNWQTISKEAAFPHVLAPQTNSSGLTSHCKLLDLHIANEKRLYKKKKAHKISTISLKQEANTNTKANHGKQKHFLLVWLSHLDHGS